MELIFLVFKIIKLEEIAFVKGKYSGAQAIHRETIMILMAIYMQYAMRI